MSETKDTINKKNNRIYIHLISDIHTGNDIIYNKKKKLVSNIINSTKDNNNNIIIMAGDLTHNGFGKAKFLCFSCCLCLNSGCNCNENIKKSDELSTFITEIYNPLKTINPMIFLCHGNHDESSDNMSYPVVDFIKESVPAGTAVTNKGCYYYIYCNIIFIFLGKYPDADAINFFERVHLETGGKYKYIITCHYQMNQTPTYDFWSSKEKMEFAKCVDKKDIICLLHGHIHITESNVFYSSPSNKPVYTFCGSDDNSYCKLQIKNETIENYESIFS